MSQSQRANGTYCLTLTDTGKLGWPHSGEASLFSQIFPYEQFYGTVEGAGVAVFGLKNSCSSQ